MAFLRPIVDVEIDAEAFANQIIEESGITTRELTERIAKEMEDEVVNIVEAELPSSDNSKPYQTALANSFTSDVEQGSGPGGYPWRAFLTIKPGVSKGKIGALNYGVTPRATDYWILPRHTPRALELRGEIRRGPSSPKYGDRAFAQAVHRTMTSGPRTGALFMERARETVLARYGISE